MKEKSFNLSEWNIAVGQMFAHLNDAELPDILIGAICRLVSIDMIIITLRKKHKTPVCIYNCGIPPEEHEIHIERYLSGAYLLDPVYQSLFSGIKPGFYNLKELTPDNFEQSEYYRIYYKATRVLADVLYLIELSEDTSLTIELGRNFGKPPYTKQEQNYLRIIEPVLENVARHHWGHLATGSIVSDSSVTDLSQHLKLAFKNFSKSILTKRETELTHLMLQGHSIKSAANEMQISPDTVKMHRKNLYAKLNISTQPELFFLFISSLSYVGKGLDQDPLSLLIENETIEKLE
jgi:DNA-binding CsgD family transcriptional regulator